MGNQPWLAYGVRANTERLRKKNCQQTVQIWTDLARGSNTVNIKHLQPSSHILYICTLLYYVYFSPTLSYS